MSMEIHEKRGDAMNAIYAQQFHTQMVLHEESNEVETGKYLIIHCICCFSGHSTSTTNQVKM